MIQSNAEEVDYLPACSNIQTTYSIGKSREYEAGQKPGKLKIREDFFPV